MTDTGHLHPLTDDRRMLVDAVRTLAREHIAPRAAEVDHTAEFPWDAVELMRQNDVFALAFPEEYGGTGTGTLTHLQAVEELSWADATVGLILSVQALGGLPVLLAGTDEQKQRYLPRWASGEWIAAYALTEPGAGSDAGALATRATRDGDEWVLDGVKRFITNAGVAHTYIVFARSDDGICAFVVEADDPGFSVGRIEPKMGIKGSTTGELLLDSCRIPGRPPVGRGGRGLPPGNARARPLPARASPPRRSASARRRSTTPPATPPSGSRSESRSQTSRGSSSCWPTWRPRSRPPAGSSTGSGRCSTPASRAPS